MTPIFTDYTIYTVICYSKGARLTFALIMFICLCIPCMEIQDPLGPAMCAPSPLPVQISGPGSSNPRLTSFLEGSKCNHCFKNSSVGNKKKRKHCQELLKGKQKTHLIFFFKTLPISCQVNLLSLRFIRNHETRPKAILYSQ